MSMKKSEIISLIENFAKPEDAEKWDLSGNIIETQREEIKRIMLCLTVTKNVIEQAKKQKCDMIISHHPLFFVPLDFMQGIDIYCAHTNLDKAKGGTTDTLIEDLGFTEIPNYEHDFLRFCEFSVKIHFTQLLEQLKKLSKNIRYTNPKNINLLSKIAFCAGSGTEFWQEAFTKGAEVLVTGDLKFHTAIDSKIAIIDIGHFESEIGVLRRFEELLKGKIEIFRAKENTPITQI